MDKFKIRIIFGVLIIIIGVGGFFVVKNVKENNVLYEIGEEYTPEAELSEEQDKQTIVSLFFIDKQSNKLTPEARIVDAKELITMPCERLMELLIDGPKNEKLDKVIPKGTKILKTFTEKDCLTIDFTKDFLNYDMEKENAKDNLINSIINTMTQLTEINEVKFLIEGQENEQFKGTYKAS